MKITILIACLLLSSVTRSQVMERIDTDRPDQTETPGITPKGWIQAEIGFQVDRDAGNNFWLHPSALWKYGLTKWFEFRLITEFVSASDPAALNEGKTVRGLLPLQFGGKIRLFEEKGAIPQTSLIFHNTFSRLSSRQFRTSRWAPNFRFVMNNDLSQRASLGYNLGAEWDGENPNARWLYTFAPALNMGKHWRMYIESYGFIGKGISPEHSLAGGIIYYVSNDVMLDISPSFGLTKAAVDRYLTIGLSFRFH